MAKTAFAEENRLPRGDPLSGTVQMLQQVLQGLQVGSTVKHLSRGGRRLAEQDPNLLPIVLLVVPKEDHLPVVRRLEALDPTIDQLLQLVSGSPLCGAGARSSPASRTGRYGLLRPGGHAPRNIRTPCFRRARKVNPGGSPFPPQPETRTRTPAPAEHVKAPSPGPPTPNPGDAGSAPPPRAPAPNPSRAAVHRTHSATHPPRTYASSAPPTAAGPGPITVRGGLSYRDGAPFDGTGVGMAHVDAQAMYLALRFVAPDPLTRIR